MALSMFVDDNFLKGNSYIVLKVRSRSSQCGAAAEEAATASISDTLQYVIYLCAP